MARAQILVVEDESITAMEIEDRLKNLGYSVSASVSSGEEAIQKAKETRPDLVLMDIKLKGDMDGIEAAEEIRCCFNIPVVYLTAYADEEIMERAKITEPYGYILKPFEERELYTAIEIALYRYKMEEVMIRSHEARNSLAVISSTAQFLLEHTDNPQLCSECAQQIHVSAQRASLIIANFLEFIRPSEGKWSSVNINSILSEILSMLEMHPKSEEQIEFETDFTESASIVRGNKNLLKQAFLNIILNAFNVLSSGEKLSIKTKINTENQVEIQIADTGCGIPEENLKMVFEPSFTTMPAGKGTGLGLSIVKRIVKRHGGSIEVESEVGKGTRFTTKLPKASFE